MRDTGVEQHLNELARDNPDYRDLVLRTREIVLAVAPNASESVKYGGIVFAAPVQFCGVFAYARHVSLEFGRGFELEDRFGVLEGSGKLRRHIKLRAAGDADAKHVRDYVAQAYRLILL